MEIKGRANEKAKSFGYEARVALLSFSNFGYPHREHMERVRAAVKILDESMKYFSCSKIYSF